MKGWASVIGGVVSIYTFTAAMHGISAATEAHRLCQEEAQKVASSKPFPENLEAEFTKSACCQMGYLEAVEKVIWKAMNPIEQAVFIFSITRDKDALVSALQAYSAAKKMCKDDNEPT